MIHNFSDHSANERTLLAWVRTAIAVMAFGFLVERFDLFLQVTRASFLAHATVLPSPHFGQTAGLALIVFGLAIIAVATIRFVNTARKIDDTKSYAGPGTRFDLTLSVLLFLLGCALLAYLVSSVVTQG